MISFRVREWDAMCPPEYRGVRRFKVVRIRLLGGFSVSVGSRTIAHNELCLRKALSLTLFVAVMLERFPETRWIAGLIGSPDMAADAAAAD
jgi:hypothetical protein